MQQYINFKEKARILRSQGKTYSEIMESLKMTFPKSTLSDWCSNVKLPSWHQSRINELNNKSLNKARKIAWVSNKIKRERFLTELLERNKDIDKKLEDLDVLKIALAMLYLGEGAKWKSHRGLQLGSSDSNIIRLYLNLLKRCYGISTNQLKCRISHRADQNINSLNRYWSKITDIPLINFYKSKPDPRTIGRPTKRRSYKGVCVVSCAGTHIQLELEAIPNLILKGL